MCVCVVSLVKQATEVRSTRDWITYVFLKEVCYPTTDFTTPEWWSSYTGLKKRKIQRHITQEWEDLQVLPFAKGVEISFFTFRPVVFRDERKTIEQVKTCKARCKHTEEK